MTEDLHKAAESGNLDRLRSLLEGGINPNAEDEEGESALRLACWRGHTEIVELLIAQGANVNFATDSEFYTALMIASYHGHTDIVRILLKHGAKVNAEDDYNATALTRAAE